MALPSIHRPVVTRTARAKINLALAVDAPTGPDGLHPIASWMARLDLADDLELTRLEVGYLSRYAIIWKNDAPKPTPIDWSITKDLAVRAHLLLEERTGSPLPVQMKLEKRIPVGGGLGGGSADAAAVLLATNELFELGLAPEELARLGATLGSDVPYCLLDGPALVEGLGEEVEPTPAVSAFAVLVFPDFGCPTGEVYRAFDAAPARAAFAPGRVRDLARAGGTPDPRGLFNDLAEPARTVRPELGELIDAIEDDMTEHPAHVTGSGSTLFVLCPAGRREARRLAADIRSRADGPFGPVAAVPAVIG